MKEGLADAETVAVGETDFVDARLADPGAIVRFKIAKNKAGRAVLQDAMTTRGELVIDDDVVVGLSADSKGGAAERHDALVAADDDLKRHGPGRGVRHSFGYLVGLWTCAA